MTKKSTYSSVEKALNFLLNQQKVNFNESLHRLTFPRIALFGSIAFESHETNFFQRAIALEALLCAKDMGFSIPKDIIDKETNLIIQSKHPYVKGGWSYMPHLPDFPPDLDDLGIVLQVAPKIQNQTLDEICNLSIDIVFESCVNIDGSISTWIIDKRDVSEPACKIKRCIEIIGGLGVHIDVMANFLEAMVEHNRWSIYKQQIEKGIEYIFERQEPEGYWTSKWYWGNLYCTYRVSNLINKLNIENDVKEKIYSFVKATQKNNGSWGEGEGNALDTAFGLLCVLNFQIEDNTTIIQKGLQWLLDNQTNIGSWASNPFIKMETRNGILSYGSQTVTTSFALKALLKSMSATH